MRDPWDEDTGDWDGKTQIKQPKKKKPDPEDDIFEADTGIFDISKVKDAWDGVTSEVTNVLRNFPENIPRQDMTRERYDNLDIARGLAIALMMLSHTVMALNTYKMLPDYAFVPVHLVTKFSSSLFIVIFGISISQFYLPHYDTESWPSKRNRLLWRSFNILLWYKILTVVQMFQTRTEEHIIDTLLFKHFTDFAEVLNFYWIVMIWILILIPFWSRSGYVAKILIIAAIGYSGVLLNQHFEFFGNWQIKAIFVEYKGTFCYGQFQRGALALFGMLIGGALLKRGNFKIDKYKLGAVSVLLAIGLGAFFMYLTRESPEYRSEILMKISKNWGKHPPNLEFMTFSLFGAFSLLGLCMLVPGFLTIIFKPFSLIGREPFLCFNWHLILIFVGFRYLLGLRWQVTYGETIALFCVVFVSSFLISPINTYIKRKGVLWKFLLP